MRSSCTKLLTLNYFYICTYREDINLEEGQKLEDFKLWSELLKGLLCILDEMVSLTMSPHGCIKRAKRITYIRLMEKCYIGSYWFLMVFRDTGKYLMIILVPAVYFSYIHYFYTNIINKMSHRKFHLPTGWKSFVPEDFKKNWNLFKTQIIDAFPLIKF